MMLPRGLAPVSDRRTRIDQEGENMATLTDHEAEQIQRANATGRTPVVFVHGLWLLPSSWDRWAAVFEEAGYTPLTPGWPDDPETVEQANANPEVFAHKTVAQVADHFAEAIGRLTKKPAVIGHSFGGLLAQILAGRGLAAASVAIDPAPFRGVLPLPISALKSARPVLGNPANRNRAVPLSYEQFRFGFANAVSEDEAKELYSTFAVPASGVPLFQAATANLNPWTEAKVNSKNPDRGPLLIVALALLHSIVVYPAEIVNAAAGFAYGFFPALAIVTVAWMLSALLCYAVGLRVARPLLDRWFGQARFERFEPRAATLQHLRLHIELVAADEIKAAQACAQHGAKVLFEVGLHVPGCLRHFREQPPDDLIDTQLFHILTSARNPAVP